ncbi:MAG: SH3 domain-containing protein [Bdellovibrionales bacterium]|nr:SH3 domain-containing protein [Bdellovibrionales bacterium]
MDGKKKKFLFIIAAVGALGFAASSALGSGTKQSDSRHASSQGAADAASSFGSAGDQTLDTDEVLIRLASYEQRILNLEQDERPNVMVPTATALSSYHGGEKIASVEDQIAKTQKSGSEAVSLSEHMMMKKQLKKRIEELETALQTSEELIVELKKVRPSTAQLKAFGEERAKNSEIITKLTERIQELERDINQPQVQDIDSADTRLKEELTEAQQQILKLTEQRNSLIDRMRAMKAESTQHREASESDQKTVAALKAELRQAQDDYKSVQDQLRAFERQLNDYERVQQELSSTNQKLAEFQSANAELKSQVAGLNTATENNAYLRKELESAQNELKEVKIEARSSSAKLNSLTSKTARIEPELEKARAENTELRERSAKMKAHLEELKQRQEDFEKTLATLRDNNTKLEQANSTSEQELATLKQWVKSIRDEKRSLESEKKDLTEKLDGAAAALRELKEKTEKSDGLISARDEELANTNRQLSRTIQDAKELEAKLAEKDKALDRIPELERELIEARNQLLLKETELARLSDAGQADRALVNTPARKPAAAVSSRPTADVLIVEVIPRKVNLRVGPGQEHSPLMQIRKGSRLTVEQRSGDWYRVMTPEGKRAYIRTDVVRPINSVQPSQRSDSRGQMRSLEPFGSVRSPAPAASSSQDSDEESQALDYLRSSMQGR